MTQPLGAPRGNNAYEALRDMLQKYGLQVLAPVVLQMLQQGHTQDEIPILLQDTSAWKKRFAGNEIRRKNGLSVLNPAEYLATEASYRQIMESNGLPQGFYDHPNDFADWIGKNVSPQEISTRVGYAVDATQRLDEGTKKAFLDYYGVGPDHLTAFFLDQERALPHIQQAARAAQIGGTANTQGVGFTKAQAEKLATSTIGDNELGRAVNEVAGLSRDLGKLGSLYGENYDQMTAANDVFFNDAEAERKRKKLVNQERATFGGDSGIGRSSLSQAKNY